MRSNSAVLIGAILTETADPAVVLVVGLGGTEASTPIWAVGEDLRQIKVRSNSAVLSGGILTETPDPALVVGWVALQRQRQSGQ